MSLEKESAARAQEFWHNLFSSAPERVNYSPDEKQVEFTPGTLSALRLMREPQLPVSIHSINQFPEGAKRRLYRTLLPPDLLTSFGVDPISWKGPGGEQHVALSAPADKGLMKLVVRHAVDARDPLAYLELVDNAFNGINVVLLVINDPNSPRFDTDLSPQGENTLFGTVHRNREAEQAAMEAGLAPGQVRTGLRASRAALQHLEAFLLLMGHDLFYMEPLTYVAAVLFERMGASYMTGRRLMETIDAEFRPGGKLYEALDGSTPFRRREQWQTIRGRAWAIHDGILEVIDQRWDDIRMTKRLGRNAGVNTFPDGKY